MHKFVYYVHIFFISSHNPLLYFVFQHFRLCGNVCKAGAIICLHIRSSYRQCTPVHDIDNCTCEWKQSRIVKFLYMINQFDTVIYAGNLHRKFVAPWCIRCKTKLQTVTASTKTKQICLMKKLVNVNHVCVSSDNAMLCWVFWQIFFFGSRAKCIMLVIYSTTVQNKVQTLCFSRNILHLFDWKVILRFLVFSSCYRCVFEPKNCLVQRIFGANLQRYKHECIMCGETWQSIIKRGEFETRD